MNRNHLLLLAIAACSGAAAAGQSRPARDAIAERAVRAVRAVRDAESVVLAHVVSVLPSPGVWCGIAVTRQVVTYAVDEVVAGTPRAGEVQVGHLLVAGSELVSPDGPMLRADLIWPGARAMLCLSHDADGKLVVVDESFGAQLLDGSKDGDRDQLELLRLTVALPEVAPFLHLEPGAQLLVRLDEVVPLPLPLVSNGRPVAFLSPELLGQRRHLRVRRCDVARDHARVEFEVVGEGAFGSVQAVRGRDGWVLTDR
ncbi:MAG TPA: hypothetical protein VFZ65_20645, partial [Planctomycetota bacterium]|nr:hypothetical protein [Planctomycetota bacterium]